MRGFVISAGALVLACAAALGQAGAQAGDASVTFEVASVRPARSSGGDQSVMGGPGTTSPGRVTFTNCSLETLLLLAYGVRRDRSDRLSGPAWLRTETFDIMAKVPEGATQDQLPLMLQNLLTERFKLALHRETKEVDGYALEVAKNGPNAKLKDPAVAKSELDKDGFPKLAPGVHGAYSLKSDRSAARVVAIQLPMAEIAKLFRQAAGGVDVADKTGLTGVYNVTLYFSQGGTIEDPAGNFKATLQKELGLRLEKTRVPTDVLIVDHIEKVPTEN
jgi:uncharacterized protein (TIGR03435 family)